MDRRLLLKSSMALAGSNLVGSGFAQTPQPPQRLPNGCTAEAPYLHGITLKDQTLFWEGNIGIDKFSLGAKVPFRDVEVTRECKPYPPPAPPKPPKPPKPPRPRGAGYWDFDTFFRTSGYWVIDPEAAETDFASSVFWDTGLPRFAYLASSSAVMTASAALADGRIAEGRFGLKRVGSGFVLSEPAQLAAWMITTGGSAVRTKFGLDGVMVGATANGADNYGAALFLGDYPMVGWSSTITATGFTSQEQSVNQN